MHHPVYKGYCLQYNDTYDFEIKYMSGKGGCTCRCCKKSQPSRLDGTKESWFHYTRSKPMHDTNTDVNHMWWTEVGCNNAFIDPRVCSKGDPSTARGGIKPSRYWALRHDLSIEDGCISYLGKLLIPSNIWEYWMMSLHRNHTAMSKIYLEPWGKTEPIETRQWSSGKLHPMLYCSQATIRGPRNPY